MAPTSFLTLPPEIRFQIYDHIFTNGFVYKIPKLEDLAQLYIAGLELGAASMLHARYSNEMIATEVAKALLSGHPFMVDDRIGQPVRDSQENNEIPYDIGDYAVTDFLSHVQLNLQADSLTLDKATEVLQNLTQLPNLRKLDFFLDTEPHESSVQPTRRQVFLCTLGLHKIRLLHSAMEDPSNRINHIIDNTNFRLEAYLRLSTGGFRDCDKPDFCTLENLLKAVVEYNGSHDNDFHSSFRFVKTQHADKNWLLQNNDRSIGASITCCDASTARCFREYARSHGWEGFHLSGIASLEDR